MTTLRIHRSVWNDSLDCLVAVEGFDGKHAVAEPLSFKPYTPGEYLNPTFQIPMGNAQALMDELWAAGIRPTDHKGAPGQLAATEKHLADMRWLALTTTKQLLAQDEKMFRHLSEPKQILSHASLELPKIHGLGPA